MVTRYCDPSLLNINIMLFSFEMKITYIPKLYGCLDLINNQILVTNTNKSISLNPNFELKYPMLNVFVLSNKIV